MAQPPPVRQRRPVWATSAVIVSVGYVLAIGLVLGERPDSGRANAAELAAGLQTALQQRDPQVLESLFDRGALPRGYAEGLIGQLPAGAQIEARPVRVGERDAITASVISGPERWCAGWLVAPEGDRLVLSVTPALAPC
jgi:hypothetical protein